ncbi:hypothetical protein FRX31_022200, partial [Thalictrum thalictroides]
IEQYKAEVQRLRPSETAIKTLSVNYAALLKEKEVGINHLLGQSPWSLLFIRGEAEQGDYEEDIELMLDAQDEEDIKKLKRRAER